MQIASIAGRVLLIGSGRLVRRAHLHLALATLGTRLSAIVGKDRCDKTGRRSQSDGRPAAESCVFANSGGRSR